MSEILIFVFLMSLIACASVWYFEKNSANLVPWKRRTTFCFCLVIMGVALLGSSLIGWNMGREAPRQYGDDTPLERFLSGEEVELRDILHNLHDSAMLPSLVKLWAAKNFPDRRPDKVCRAVIGEIYRAKVKMVLPASIAENVAAKFAEESVPSASMPAPDMAPTPAPTPTPAE